MINARIETPFNLPSADQNKGLITWSTLTSTVIDIFKNNEPSEPLALQTML